MSHLMNTYNRQPVAFTHGEGAWLFDENGSATSMPFPALL
jgi:acetylornithine/N-succinyldiaminopimelate aminotransferase